MAKTKSGTNNAYQDTDLHVSQEVTTVWNGVLHFQHPGEIQVLTTSSSCPSRKEAPKGQC